MKLRRVPSVGTRLGRKRLSARNHLRTSVWVHARTKGSIINKPRNVYLLSALAILVAIALLATQGIGMAKPSSSPEMKEQAKEEKKETKKEAKEEKKEAKEAKAAKAEDKEQAKAENEMCTMCMDRLHRMSQLKAKLDEAKSAAEAEGAKKTLSQIEEALKMLETTHREVHKCLQRHVDNYDRCMGTRKGEGRWERDVKCPMCSKMMEKKRVVVNSVCPITGKKFNPCDVPDNRIREFHGKKVGFCCPNCPPAWDKLSDADKQTKLDAAMKASPKKGETAKEK